jgi:7,8-dihydropterin-6-yl-methyl-4-(beta-D-ribofuranosyl)aminobenzene 5'-phosphate synthase
VLQNARELKVDLSNVKDVILTHNHDDHTGGLITLRKEFMKANPAALSRVHGAKGIFYSRPGKDGEGNSMIATRKEYEATGGTFVEHDQAVELFPGAWLTGPVPRPFPERNWSVSGEVVTPAGKVEDTIPEDQSLVLNTSQGLVVVTGCGHAGIVNILTYAKQRFPNEPVYGLVGGLHLFKMSQGEVTLPEKTEPRDDMTPASPSREEVTRTCLEAHRTLMDIHPDNVSRFKDVAAFLAEDLKKLKAAQ